MGRVEEMVVGWDTARGGPAPGPGWQMTPACRPNRSNAGFPVVGEELAGLGAVELFVWPT